MSQWSTRRIDELGRVVTGKTPSSDNPEEFGSDYPFITPSDIPRTQRRVIAERWLSEKGMEAHKRILLPPKSVCVVCIGATIGKVCATDRLSFANQQINTVIPNELEANPEFVYYLCATLRDTLVSFAGGAATPIVNKSAFSAIKMLVPSRQEQEKIAAILSAYDDLIENNRRRIALLEKMAEEIYREWFVRMRFPGHEQAKFEKGIPVDWQLRTIGDLCARVTDGSHFSPEWHPDGKYMASVKDMESHGFSKKSMKTISEQDFENLARSDCKPRKGDVLIAKDGSYLKHVFVWNDEMEVVLLSSIAILRPNEREITPHFLATVLRQESTKTMMSGYVSGSALPRIILNDFKRMKLLIPARSLVEQFEGSASSIFRQIDVLNRMNEKLERSRDSLLPRLISGKLPVEHLDIHFPPGMQEAG